MSMMLISQDIYVGCCVQPYSSQYINLAYPILDSVEKAALAGPSFTKQAETKSVAIGVSRQGGPRPGPETRHA